MIDPPDKDLSDLREAWIESMLISASKPIDHSTRIERAMRQLELDDAKPTPSQRNLRRARLWQLSSFGAAAAAVLVMFLLVQNGGATSARAAIQRSIDVAADSEVRQYDLQIKFIAQNGERYLIENDLYVRGSSHLALRHPALIPGKSFWLGHDESEAWVVPAIGPVIKGDRSVLQRWLKTQNDLDTPYLHLATLLQRMSQGYRLEMLDDELISVAGSQTVACQHVRAQLKASNDNDLPVTIDLWASRQTGMAVRLEASWQLSADQTGREAVTLNFETDTLSLPDDWFTAEGHYEGRRRVVNDETSSNATRTEELKK